MRNKYKYTTTDMVQLAKSKGFVFISKKFNGVVKKHKWKCSLGHVWSARPFNIMNGTGCPVCSHSKPRKTKEDAQIIGQARGFVLLSEVFLGVKKKHEWKCPDGHTWFAAPETIKRNGCPKCSGGIREEQVRFIFETLLGYKFPKDKKILKGLELDGYCKELKLAFEYNGKQHYQPHFLNNNNASAIQKRDTQKNNMCKLLSINMISIPYTENNGLELFIKQKLIHLGYKNFHTIDWTKFIGKPSKLKELQSIAIERNGKLLSSQYSGSHEKHEWYCNKCKTKWMSIAKDVRDGHWCPTCANNKKYTLEKVQNICKGFKIISAEYLGMNALHIFICLNCHHEFSIKPNRIQQGAKCPSCKK